MNLVLIGMPGCGKSTVGPLLRRPFYDSDAEIERTENRSIADIFDTDGEARFRALEVAAIARLAALDGITIATGGGAVLNRDNVTMLKNNGILVYLQRPPAQIQTTNNDRPLLRDPCKWNELYRQRRSYYEQAADITVRNDKTPEECAEEILRGLENL